MQKLMAVADGLISKERRESCCISSKPLQVKVKDWNRISNYNCQDGLSWTADQLEKSYKLNLTLKQRTAIVFTELETRRNWLCSMTELGITSAILVFLALKAASIICSATGQS